MPAEWPVLKMKKQALLKPMPARPRLRSLRSAELARSTQKRLRLTKSSLKRCLASARPSTRKWLSTPKKWSRKCKRESLWSRKPRQHPLQARKSEYVNDDLTSIQHKLSIRRGKKL